MRPSGLSRGPDVHLDGRPEWLIELLGGSYKILPVSFGTNLEKL